MYPSDLINTLEAPGEFDALTRLRKDETYFVLVARDSLAPELVEQWADKNRRRALEDADQAKITADTLARELRKSTEAEMIAADMRAYKKGHAPEPKVEEGTRPTYSGHVLPEETRRADELRSARIRAGSAVRNAISELNDLAKLWEESGGPGDGKDEAECIRETIGIMKRADEWITPARPGIKG